MADIIITIPNAQLNRVVNSVCSLRGYQDNILDIDGNSTPNPETRQQFARRQLIEFLKDHVRSFEAQRDSELARINAINTVNSEINIT